MNQVYDFANSDQSNMVYVRPVRVDELPDEIRAQTGDLATVYSVHSQDGQRLALVGDRKLAFALARQHDFAPVNVH